jgi:hypothetical protein
MILSPSKKKIFPATIPLKKPNPFCVLSSPPIINYMRDTHQTFQTHTRHTKKGGSFFITLLFYLGFMVEAAGVEPASGNLQQGASTYIAVALNLVSSGSQRQDSEETSLLSFASRL